jgi:PADRE domain
MSCFSSRAVSFPVEKASKVVMLDGTIREFSRCTIANHAMEDESDCIIFDTNKLHIGEYILPLKPDAELESGHTYMLLPQSMLHHRLDSVDMEKLSLKVKEAVLVAAVEKMVGRSSSFCCLREMLSGQEIEERIRLREEKREKKEGEDVQISKTGSRGKIIKTGSISGEGKKEKKVERKQSKSQYVWYLGFASFPIEEDY